VKELAFLKEPVRTYKAVIIKRIGELTAKTCENLEDDSLLPILLVFITQSFMVGIQTGIELLNAMGITNEYIATQMLKNGDAP
jgi:hypothetical protein